MPTRFLLDTNIITALAQKNMFALSHLPALDESDEIYTCFVVSGEWEYGVRNAPGAQRRTEIQAAGVAIFSALTEIWESV